MSAIIVRVSYQTSDTKYARLEGIQDERIKLIVTSPPYLNAYDYHKYHRHWMQWIDGDVTFARDREIGKHDTLTRKGATPEPYFADMELCV